MAKIISDLEIECDVERDWDNDNIRFNEDVSAVFRDSSGHDKIEVHMNGKLNFAIPLSELEQVVETFKAKGK